MRFKKRKFNDYREDSILIRSALGVEQEMNGVEYMDWVRRWRNVIPANQSVTLCNEVQINGITFEVRTDVAYNQTSDKFPPTIQFCTVITEIQDPVSKEEIESAIASLQEMQEQLADNA